ncbi:MAG: hypothetical protein ACYDDP_02090 [Acidithiobacillus sp.]
MPRTNTSNTISPQASALTRLAAQCFIDGDHALLSALGDAIDVLLVEEDDETLQAVSYELVEQDIEAEADFWEFAKERAEMFLSETGEVTTLFAIPILEPDQIAGFSADQAAAALVRYGLVCESATVTFYPVPVDGGRLLNMDPVDIFRLHRQMGMDHRLVAEMLGSPQAPQSVPPYICFIGTITYPAQLPGPCLAWQLDVGEYLERFGQWSDHVDQEVLGLATRSNALGIPGRFAFAVREGAQEYQDLMLVDFIENAANFSRKPRHILAKLTDGMMEELTLELYDAQQHFGALQISWRALGETRAEILEKIFDALRVGGVSGIMFETQETSPKPDRAVH